MHTHQFFTWITHSKEYTTLHLDNTHCREHNSTRLQEALHLYVQHCNRIVLVQYSIHIFINSRLDVTFSVRHHFRIKLYQTLPYCPQQ